jgi:hypothetical protein
MEAGRPPVPPSTMVEAAAQKVRMAHRTEPDSVSILKGGDAILVDIKT